MNTRPSSNRYLRLQISAVASLLAACVPAVASAQTTPRTTDGTTRDVRVVETNRTLKKADRDFMEKAAKASMSEVAISRVAASRTSNPEVRRFAQMMVEDHDSANEQLASLASGRGVSLPAKDPAPDKWEKRDAKNFDK